MASIDVDGLFILASIIDFGHSCLWFILWYEDRQELFRLLMQIINRRSREIYYRRFFYYSRIDTSLVDFVMDGTYNGEV